MPRNTENFIRMKQFFAQRLTSNKLLLRLISVLIGLFFISGISAQNLQIDGHSFTLDDQPFDMWGVRVASASQNEEYTSGLISNLDDYKASGINCISVYLQGSSGGYSEPFLDGGSSIDKGHLSRYKKIINECAKRDIVVIAGIFYQRTVKNPEMSNLKSEEDVVNAVKTFTKAMKPFNNIIINIANEQNSSHYKSFEVFNFNNPENIIKLCKVVKETDPKRIVGGGGYHDDSNVTIGKSKYVDVLLFDTFGGDVEENQHSGWHYDYFREQGVPDKPIVNVELFGGWTKMFLPQGVYTEKGKAIHFTEIEEAKKRPGLSVHLHSNPWFQGVAQDLGNRYDLGGEGTENDPGVRWYFNKIKEELIFQSGFEPNSKVIPNNSSPDSDSDIIGRDLSLTAKNDWVNDFDNHPDIGDFMLQYQGGDESMRFAKIIPEPGNYENHVLHFWLDKPNVQGKKGRIQGNIYGGNGLTEFYQSERIFLHEDFNQVRKFPDKIHWLTIAEYWNNITWKQDVPFGFRITLGIGKPTEEESDLYFILDAQDCQIFENGRQKYITLWAETNEDIKVPIGKWFTLEYYYKEGDADNGRYYMTIQPEGEEKVVVFDIMHVTHNSKDPNPDGVSDFNPIKLYTSKKLIDYMHENGKALQIYWDDFKLWKNKRPTD